MFISKKDHKKRHPYVGITVLSLAAAGVVSIVRCGKRFIQEKTAAMTAMVKGMKE